MRQPCAQDGTTTQDYTVIIEKEGAPPLNSLDSILVDGEMIPGFALSIGA
jgi:hypothetical protein